MLGRSEGVGSKHVRRRGGVLVYALVVTVPIPTADEK
jgi:hypothetical protein